MKSSNDTITVYIGDTTDDLASKALKEDPEARLISSATYQNLSPGTYFTSLGDLKDLNEFSAVLRQADNIHYHPPRVWSDGKVFPSKMQKWIENYLDVFSLLPAKNVTGYTASCYDTDAMLKLVDDRKSEEEQIWIAGCSISHGVGVNPDQRYGNLLCQKLDLEASFLTLPGSSISWAADQLLRSDLRKGDKIFWGITGPSRITFWHEHKKEVVPYVLNTNNKEIQEYLEKFINKKIFSTSIVVHQSVNAVMQVVNFCEKIQAQLVLAVLVRGIEHHIKHLPSFLMLTELWGRNKDDLMLDLGTDEMHPGTQSHRFYADSMLEKYQQLYC